MAAQVKTIGASGQISLGKKYAGRNVLIEEMQEGVWIIKTAQTIPDSEMWLHTPEMKAKLEEAFEWMAKNPPRETTAKELEELEQRGLAKTKQGRKSKKAV